MKKLIKQIGNSVGIIFNKEEQELYHIEIDKPFDVELVEIKKEEAKQ